MTNGPTSSGNRYTGLVLADRYEVGDLIAQDAMTETHLAQDRQLDATVAIKFLAPQLAEDGTIAERFVDDALWATRVRGTNIISILDAGTYEGMHYVVQEYVAGQTLGQRLKNFGKLDPDVACAFMDQILSALTVAHEIGIVHGDINPTNIILTGLTSVKLLDLGITRVQSSQTIAETRAMMGNPEYLSPEEAQGDEFDFTTDIYSAGIVFYEMLTGKPPFSGDSPVAVFYMHIHDLPKPITQGNPEVPAAIADTVAKALLKKPEERYQSAEEFRLAIEMARRGQHEPARTEPEVPAATVQASGKPRGKEPKEPKEPKSGKPKGNGHRVESITPGAEDMQPKTMVFSSGGSGKLSKLKKTLLVVIGAVVIAAVAGLGLRLFIGAGSVQVPELAQLQLEHAQQVVTDAGLKWRILEEESTEFAPGSIMRQAPAAGAVVSKGTEMLLTVARAPSVVRVPDLVGVVSVAAAQDRLDAVGIQIGTITEDPTADGYKGTIVAQDPLPGTVSNSNTKVNLTISAGG